MMKPSDLLKLYLALVIIAVLLATCAVQEGLIP